MSDISQVSDLVIVEGRGPSFVSGATDDHGHPVLTREDGSTETVSNIVLATGTVTDNGDDSLTITLT